MGDLTRLLTMFVHAAGLLFADTYHVSLSTVVWGAMLVGREGGGGKEERREGGREGGGGGRGEGGKGEGGREREGEREGGREGVKKIIHLYYLLIIQVL